jgi:hypothetical protein
VNPADAAWLAGFIDGEGSFMISLQSKKTANGRTSTHWIACISITSTDRRLIEHCRWLVGGGSQASVQPPGHAKLAHLIQFKGRDVDRLLAAIRPYLVGKAEQADILLALRAEIGIGAQKGRYGVYVNPEQDQRREQMRLALRALNHRGSTSIPQAQQDALKKARVLIRKRISEAALPLLEFSPPR